MSIMNDMIECSVVICTYKPDWEKLRLTLKSILMQEDCNYNIVITDDGSKINFFDEIRDYLSKYHFNKYKLIANNQNQGTVQNILQGLRTCDGALVKPISPGDFLHGRHALRTWIDYMYEHEEYVMSYCDAIYYRMVNGKVFPIKTLSQPQSRKPNAEQYILYGDLCLGASTMVRRQTWLKYLEMLQGKVIYAEDFSYQVMLYCGDKIINIPKPLLLYEFGTGVSTSGSSFWAEKLHKDDEAIKQIILSIKPSVEVGKYSINQYLRIKNDKTLFCRLKKLMLCPSKILFRFRREFFPRKTSIKTDKLFLDELLD